MTTAPDVPLTCYRHRGAVTAVRCTRCDRPICTGCMREAAIGYQCPDCVRPITRRRRLTGRRLALLAVAALAAAAAVAVLVLWVSRPQPAPTGQPPTLSTRVAGLPAGYRPLPVVPLPSRVPAYPGIKFLGFDSSPTIDGVQGTWLFVAPGANCDAVLAFYTQALGKTGNEVTGNGAVINWRSADVGTQGIVQCPFATPADASGVALSGPWIAITTMPTSSGP